MPIITKIEDQSKQTNGKIDSNHETLIQLLSKADAKAQKALEKLSLMSSILKISKMNSIQ